MTETQETNKAQDAFRKWRVTWAFAFTETFCA